MLYGSRLASIGMFLLMGFTLADCATKSVGGNSYIELCNERLQVLGILVGIDTLVDVQNALGSANPLARSEHDDARICYIVDDGVVIFEAGALGGWNTITGFRVFKPKSYFEASSCTPLPGKKMLQSIVPAISYSDTPQVIQAQFGMPNSKTKENLSYRQSGQLPMSATEVKYMRRQWGGVKDEQAYWDLTCLAEFDFKDGRLISAHFQRFESF